MKCPYDSHYWPPAPTVEIRLGAPGESLASGPYQALIDTGADISLIPARYVKPLQTTPDDHRYLRSQWGERRQVAIYSLDMGIGDIRLPAIQVVADEQGTEIVLGRNVLNELIMMLDGPSRVLEIPD